MPGSSLTAGELSLVLQELEPLLVNAQVRDVALLEKRDDLLLFLDCADVGRTLHVALGASRARVTLTRRRFRRDEFRSGPLVDRLRAHLQSAVLTGVQIAQGERRCDFSFSSSSARLLSLHVELFGVRGFWCLTQEDGLISDVSRIAKSATRGLNPGATYSPPVAPIPHAAEVDQDRFHDPYAETIDRWFTERDHEEESELLRQELLRGLLRTKKKLTNAVDGLRRQEVAIASTPELRLHADMLLAHGFVLPPKATTLEVPHPEDEERTLTYALQPGVPIQKQAEALYKRARKLEAGAKVARERIQKSEEDLALAGSYAREVEKAASTDLRDWQRKLVGSGLLPKRPTPQRPASPKKARNPRSKSTDRFRSFESKEGHRILVGRTNHDNDRLSISVARGNDLWFHIGKGYAGSHVVVRVPKGKTASLETMIDAGMLATHFSKQRGVPITEVIYTQAKNIRKPKGLPPGRVTANNTKSLTIRYDPARLDRLLDSVKNG